MRTSLRRDFGPEGKGPGAPLGFPQSPPPSFKPPPCHLTWPRPQLLTGSERLGGLLAGRALLLSGAGRGGGVVAFWTREVSVRPSAV